MKTHSDQRKIQRIVDKHFAGYDQAEIIGAIAYWWKMPVDEVWALYLSKIELQSSLSHKG